MGKKSGWKRLGAGEYETRDGKWRARKASYASQLWHLYELEDNGYGMAREVYANSRQSFRLLKNLVRAWETLEAEAQKGGK
jgi:hypothetical protein